MSEQRMHKVRRIVASKLFEMIEKRRGADVAHSLLWGATCFPFDVPSWQQIWRCFLVWDGILPENVPLAIADSELEKALSS